MVCDLSPEDKNQGSSILNKYLFGVEV